jgi:hypothetical protein
VNKKFIRWILFFPIALICSIVTFLISGSIFRLILFDIFDEPVWNDSNFWEHFERLFSHFTSGFVFVWVGAICAPRNQFMVSIILCTTGVMFVITALITSMFYKFPDNIETSPNYSLMSARFIASLIAVYVVKKSIIEESVQKFKLDEKQ